MIRVSIACVTTAMLLSSQIAVIAQTSESGGPPPIYKDGMRPSQGSSVIVAYLHYESIRIRAEGRRLGREADRVRSEAKRLTRQASVLRLRASRLDDLWSNANRIDPETYKDYPGRDRSQQIMRGDADLQDADATSLQAEGQRLDDEAVRLKQLAADVDTERHLVCCSNRVTIEMLRAKIVELARSIGADYTPSRPASLSPAQ